MSRSYFADIAASSPLQHPWSLAIEEQFYLVWPLLMVGLLVALKLKSSRLLAWFGVGAVLSALWMAHVYSPADPSRAYFGTLARSPQEASQGAESADLNAFTVLADSSVNEAADRAAQDLASGLLHLGRYGVLDVSDGVDWVLEGESRSKLRILHGHFIINDLVEAFSSTGDRMFLDLAFAHVEDWISANQYQAPASEMAWHDETTARRLINWLKLIAVGETTKPDPRIDWLWAEAKGHAELLLSDDFYSSGTNHGMFQDRALLAYSAIASGDDADAYRRVATARLLRYFENVVSDGGVHLEHSPAYHQLIAASVARFADFFDRIGDATTEQHLVDIFGSMSSYATQVLKPDGAWPLVGDTFAHDEPRHSLFDNDEYRYAVSQGQNGTAPEATMAFYPEAGYAILRDGWAGGGEGTYVHFTAAYHSSYHKHSDDLSVWVYHDGDLLTEAGPNGYDYDEPLTEFAYSSHAHNTLLVDETGLPRVDGDFEATYLDSYDSGQGFGNATGVNLRFDGVRHERTVHLDLTSSLLTVTDHIDTTDEHRFTILWHTAPGLETATAPDGRIALERDGQPVAYMRFESNETSLTVHVASDDPAGRRSVRLGGVEALPTSVVSVSFEADDQARVVTIVELLD